MNSSRPLLRALRPGSGARIHVRRPPLTRQLSSDKSPISRLHKFNERLPRFLRRYTTPLLTAPVSHVAAFLVLHELTAVVPLVALAGAFHYAGWFPQLAGSETMRRGVDKWAGYFRRKGWLRDEDGPADAPSRAAEVEGEAGAGGTSERWRWVLEVASAWAVVKILMPVRIVGCVWATPWFASRLMAGSRFLGRLVGRR